MQTLSASYDFLRDNIGEGPDSTGRTEEPWSAKNERLLCEWAKEWHEREIFHSRDHIWWKRFFYILNIPASTLPLIVAGFWGDLPESEGNFLATATMTASGILSAIVTLLKPEAVAERHLYASHRYSDLISDVEEILVKNSCYRPDVDRTVLAFKIRSDSLLRGCPYVSFTKDPLFQEDSSTPRDILESE